MFQRIQYFALLLSCVMSCSYLQAMLTDECGRLRSARLDDKNSLPVKSKKKRVDESKVSVSGKCSGKRKRNKEDGSAGQFATVASFGIAPRRVSVSEVFSNSTADLVALNGGVCAAAQDCEQGDVVVVPGHEQCAEVVLAEDAVASSVTLDACEPVAKRACTGCDESKEDSFFSQWYQKCNKVFSKANLAERLKSDLPVDDLPSENRCGVSWEALGHEINRFNVAMVGIFSAVSWLNGQAIISSNGAYIPYVQKVVVAPGSTILFHGDVHGDIHSLNNFLLKSIQSGFLDENLKVVAQDCYFVFLGDYVDRGINGTEVLYTILKLKNENPDKVFLVRGNHECMMQNMEAGSAGFTEELLRKFGAGITFDHIKYVCSVYDTLPLALYIGCESSDCVIDYIQCCHGGLEMRVDPKLLLQMSDGVVYARLDQLYRNVWNDMKQDFVDEAEWQKLDTHCGHSVEADIIHNGFMWSDFLIKDESQAFKRSVRGGDDIFDFGRRVTYEYLQGISDPHQYIVHGVFRGHQHGDCDMIDLILQHPASEFDPSDRGVGKLWLSTDLVKRELDKQAGKLWDGIVCTFMVSPDGGWGQHYNYTQDYYGILTTGPGFDNWNLTIADANA